MGAMVLMATLVNNKEVFNSCRPKINGGLGRDINQFLMTLFYVYLLDPQHSKCDIPSLQSCISVSRGAVCWVQCGLSVCVVREGVSGSPYLDVGRIGWEGGVYVERYGL